MLVGLLEYLFMFILQYGIEIHSVAHQEQIKTEKIRTLAVDMTESLSTYEIGICGAW